MKLNEDDREIKAIHFPESGSFVMGQMGVDRITTYTEHSNNEYGQPWFAIWWQGKIKHRINAAYVQIVSYEDKS